MRISEIEKKQYDVRLIRFVKSTKNNRHVPEPTECEIANICLGHFDYVYAQKLGKVNTPKATAPLAMIDSDRKARSRSEDNYEYPLYLLKEVTGETDLDSFWKDDSPFTTIIRLHCGLNDIGEIALSEYLRRWCLVADGTYYGIKPGNENELLYAPDDAECSADGDGCCVYSIKYQFYDSLELGDAVVILKSNSVVAAMEVSRYLNLLPEVVDTYTYFTIRTDLFQYDDQAWAEYGEIPDKLGLAYVTTRFSVKKAEQANRFFFEYMAFSQNPSQRNYPRVHFVNGTTDALVDWGECNEKQFLTYLRQIAKAGLMSEPTNNGDSVDFHNAFNDVITRIGLVYEQITLDKEYLKRFEQEVSIRTICNWIKRNGRAGSANELRLTQFMDDVHSFRNAIKQSIGNDNNDNRFPWSRSVNRLLGTVRSIAENYVMDDLSYLLIPGVNALINRITYLLEHNNWKLEYDKEVLDYLDDLTHLINDIAHLESQLVQHPELSAVRYYIPAMVLQFEQEFVKKCSKILSDKRTFIPMLVPTQKHNISTVCPLDPNSEDYRRACALRTQIPVSMLYSPWIVAHQLCHEIAHYCGDKDRKRELRTESIAKCMADFLMHQWENRIGVNSQNCKDKLINDFRNDLEKELLRPFQNSNDQHLTNVIETMWSHMIRHILSGDKWYEQFQDVLIAELPDHDKLTYIGRNAIYGKDASAWAIVSNEIIQEHLDYLSTLCKECYADIAMILLLDCSVEDYIHSVFDEEMNAQKSEIEDTIVKNQLYGPATNAAPIAWYSAVEVQAHIDRFALVFNTIKKIKRSNIDLPSPTQDWIREAMRRISTMDRQSTEFWNGYSSGESLLFVNEAVILSNYMEECAKSLHVTLKKYHSSRHLKQLREILAVVKDDTFDWTKLQSFLRKSQQEI